MGREGRRRGTDQSPQSAMSSTSCCGVKYCVTLHWGVTGKAAEGVPQVEVSIVDALFVNSAGTSARCTPMPTTLVSTRIHPRKGAEAKGYARSRTR